MEKRWSKIDKELLIGCVFDPRLKNLSFLDEIHVFDKKEIYQALNMLINEKFKSNSQGICQNIQSTTSSSKETILSNPEQIKRMSTISSIFSKDSGCTSNEYKQFNELDDYLKEIILEDSSELEKFDVLTFWKQKTKKYPILASIVQEYLAIPAKKNYLFFTINLDLLRLIAINRD